MTGITFPSDVDVTERRGLDGDQSAGHPLADAYRQMRRQRQRSLLAQIAALPPVTNYDTAIEVITLFRQYLVTEAMGEDPDWDPRLAQQLNGALAMALTAISSTIEARDLEAALDLLR